MMNTTLLRVVLAAASIAVAAGCRTAGTPRASQEYMERHTVPLYRTYANGDLLVLVAGEVSPEDWPRYSEVSGCDELRRMMARDGYEVGGCVSIR